LRASRQSHQSEGSDHDESDFCGSHRINYLLFRPTALNRY